MQSEEEPILGPNVKQPTNRRRSSIVYGLSRPQFVGSDAKSAPSSLQDFIESRQRASRRAQASTTAPNYGSLEEAGRESSSSASASSEEIDNVQDSTWQKELRLLVSFGIPVVLTSLLQYGEVIITVFSLGHLGKTELSAASLSNMTATITAFAIYQGIVSALDTLGTQCFGSGNYELIGLHLQRILSVLCLLQLPIIFVWWNIEPILLFFKQDPTTCYLAGRYMRVLLLASPAYALFESLKRFLQVQGIFQPVTNILAFIVPLNILLNYLFVWSPWFGFGFMGAPVAVTITLWMACAILLWYIVNINGRQAWGGFSKEALRNWGPLCRLAVPGVVMICSEYWAFELLTFVAGVLGTTDLASMSVLSTTSSISYTIAFGVAAAAATRVGNLIGAGNTKLAKLSTYVAVSVAALIGLCITSLMVIFRNHWAYLFTSDKDVVQLVAKLVPLCALMNIADNTQCVAGGVLRGQGRQRIGGIVNFVAYYILALPIAIILCFYLDWGLFGLWVGITVAVFVIAAVETHCALHVNWEHLVEVAEQQIDEALNV
ncbi:MatE family transmembrane transporter [Schizosaccharomyces osmophilus]|uniref:MatE family transmembrane transporter n=1 Tax=Schizosaccharomyces osmophilus TaxID=2545709 RepID=A0AAE9WHI5_9SCHI|nr:MatE family transmembrane transporter [Schizosaccharomyces osmophilus]WBW75504.1 MatE family transmembrane transporter [Schizosaccharomyces osmophilus]